MKKKLLKNLVLALAMSMLLGLAGCGEGGPAEDEDEDERVEVTAESSVEVSAPVETQKSAVSDNIKTLFGSWTMIGTESEGYVYLSDNLEDAAIATFYEEEGKAKVDYEENDYETLEIYGASIKEMNEKLYESSTSNWYGEFGRKEKTNGEVRYFMATLEGDILHVVEHHDYLYEDYETGEMLEDYYERNCIFVRTDAPNRQEIIDSYRYLETVTVSNVKELYNAIDSRKRIILKAGVYNLSELTDADRNNTSINHSGYYDEELNEYIEYDITTAAIYMRYLDHICFEGEAGADVRIVTEDAAESPFQLDNCSDIILKNLTFGHVVDPGSCSGAVLSMYECYQLTIEDCRLFGCGTYGFDAFYCNSVEVKNCDVYECSEGLALIVNCSRWNIANTTFRDTVGYTMFALSGSWSIIFEDCVIKNNLCWGNTDCFMSAGEYDEAIFNNCVFQGNSYSNLYEGNIRFNNCTFEN